MVTRPARTARTTHGDRATGLSRADRARATREHLIATAIDVVRQRSYGQATLFEVAKAAGVTPGALQHHFGSRAVLMLEVLQAILQAVVRQLQAAQVGQGGEAGQAAVEMANLQRFLKK